MSRIGKQPITIPENVEVNIGDGRITVKGPKGELTQDIHRLVEVEKKDGQIFVLVKNPEQKQQRALWGLFRKLFYNMILGVTANFSKQLEINGIGYKALVSGDKLILNIGYSHVVEYEIAAGINIKVEKNIITITGADKQLVGQTAAKIRAFKKPEPYKGKGIKYVGEVIRRKSGKTTVKGE